VKTLEYLLAATTLVFATGCGNGFMADQLDPLPEDPIEENVIIKARAVILVSPYAQSSRLEKLINSIMPKAFAYAGANPPSSTITVSYTVAATNVDFQLTTDNTATLTGESLQLGTFNVSSLDDNKLKVCPASGQANNGSVKCQNAAIRVKITDISNNPISGFPSPDNEGNLPVTVGNQSGVDTMVGAAFANIHTRTNTGINRLRQSHFVPSTPYKIKTDLTDAGAGAYSMKIVVEYVLYN
jgi:hypothetical protein